jgi:glycosyltransferase involved in cell wall biosynthesis
MTSLPMRVLQFGKFYPPDVGGIERVMFDLAEGLNARGVACDVLCSNSARKLIDERVGGYRVVRTASYGTVLSTSITPQLAAKLREMQGGYDIIHVHLHDPMANLSLFTARPRSRVVLHWHNDIVRQKTLAKLYLPLQSWMLRRADAIITTSPNYIKGSAYLRRFEAKCHVVPVGVDKSRLGVSAATVAAIRERYGGRKIVFSIGRLSPYKGYKYLIDAAGYLGNDYAIVIAGTGPLADALARQVARAGLGARVHLIGWVRDEDLGSYYEASDIFCLSSVSRNEGFGLVQIEAMLFEKPVVSADVPGSGVAWANLNGETGLVVPPEDGRALADAIQRISSDRGLYSKFAEAGYRRATEVFTKDRMLAATMAVYERVLRAGGAQA